MYSADTFFITTAGGNSLSVKCFGSCVGPKITFSSHSIDFGSIELGSTSTKTLIVRNTSSDICAIQFITEPYGLFKIDLPHAEALIPARGSVEVKVTFTPSQPINLYKRIFCLVKNEDPVVS